MKLFLIIIDNKYYHEYAYTDRDRANRNAIHLKIMSPSRMYEVKEIDLPFIGRSVCYIHTYHGYDYIYDFPKTGIENVVSISNVYSCADHAKNDQMWIHSIEKYNQNPENHIMKDDMIASKESDGFPFSYGDIMGGKFNTKIEHIKVIKT